MAFSRQLPNTNTAEICFRQHDWEKTTGTTNDCSISYFFEENPTISMSTSIGREQKESHVDTMRERASYNAKTSLLVTKSQEQGKERTNKKSRKRNNEAKPPTAEAFVSVRARRGQATDSHSLAERVRRERISERMKLLQSLIPGCDQVTGKALVLDAIINYVKSLQNQVEFLSMTLASVDTMFGHCGMDFDDTMNQIEFNVEEELAMESEEHGGNNYLMIDPFSQKGQGPTSLSQDGSIPWVRSLILEQEQRIVNHIDLTNMNCYFQY
ncbi:hypothetical protein ZIOFF_015474 [Zingiber officinale]|uniref:BHLH domain-containing protein n=1 Tax=Zingiber officinale TaxID=94328 RepID=A0A8J5I1H7_ZINOF|nr:hypothetical protein ZIOFF_015474 [Zingiber officinale]